MLLLATLGMATPLFIIGDRLSVFIPPGPFLALMGKVGGYNHLKQLGVGSTITRPTCGRRDAGGAQCALFVRPTPGRIAAIWTMVIFVLLPIVVLAIALWPVLGGSHIGLPIPGRTARHAHRLRQLYVLLLFNKRCVTGFRFLTTEKTGKQDYEFTPAIGRRAFVLGTIGLAAAGGGVGYARKLIAQPRVSYNSTRIQRQHCSGETTPNDLPSSSFP